MCLRSLALAGRFFNTTPLRKPQWSCVCVCVCVNHLAMSNSVTPWTVDCRTLSMGPSRQEYWSGLLEKQFVCSCHSVMSDSLQPHGLQHTRLPCPSPSPGVSLTHVHWVHDATEPSHPLSSPSPPSYNLSQHRGLFQLSRIFASCGQSIETSASASVLPMNIQGLFPLRLTGLISLLSKGLSRVFFNITGLSHQFSGVSLFYCPALTSVHDSWKNHRFNYMDLCKQNNVSAF